MWLINCKTLQLEFHVNPPAHYAILSHTWGEDEVVFQDMSDLKMARRKAGFIKIERTCKLALEEHIPLAWVDTCCIDKRSSAELSEAINSMFAWYRDSTVCYVWLSDLHRGVDELQLLERDTGGETMIFEDFSMCRWFTRGWTLQELIASKKVAFYNHNWEAFGFKRTLVSTLHKITGIDKAVLLDPSRLPTLPVARRMSWTSKRQTTRAEDTAYCLLGIFDINMPLLYGEGPKAFIRLQEEIARSTNDLSLFAWTSSSVFSSFRQEYRGLFAESPAEFASCSNIIRVGSDGGSVGLVRRDAEFTVTNRGVRMESILLAGSSVIRDPNVLFLNCSRIENGVREWLGIIIAELGASADFVRAHPHTLNVTREVPQPSWIRDRRMIYLRRSVSPDESVLIAMARTTAVSVSLGGTFRLLSRKHSWFKFSQMRTGSCSTAARAEAATAQDQEDEQEQPRSYRASELMGAVQTLLFEIRVPGSTVRFAVVYSFAAHKPKMVDAPDATVTQINNVLSARQRLKPWVAIFSDADSEHRHIVKMAWELECEQARPNEDARQLIYDILFPADSGPARLEHRPKNVVVSVGEEKLVYKVSVEKVDASMAFPYPQPMNFWVTCKMVSVPEGLKRS